MDILEGRSG